MSGKVQSRIVTPQEARERLDPEHDEYDTAPYVGRVERRLAHTVATEPDRIRAAVVKALLHQAFVLDGRNQGRAASMLRKEADAIEGGADYA